MRFVFIIVAGLIVGTQAFAKTQALFSSTGANVKIIVQGPQGDLDATHLFALLNSQAVDDGSSLKKEISFIDREGVEAVNVLCKVSKQVQNQGSCTLTIKKARYSSIQPSVKYAAYGAFDAQEAARIAKLFVIPPGTKDLFSSNDNRLTIFYQNSDIGNFGIVYEGHTLN